ncbi:diacylglycerol kinase family protein [Bacillus kwashiorkori]|uniref:diacylglycerol kinase family protein n=1 Tax=Bacillus kwashiorkori TaxID=1522318 RepID=UPI000782E76B|nr:diacylglycerol kinase family protein [Bacillus kwashiorkori]
MKRLLYSFRFASEGLVTALKTEKNIKIHLTAAFVVILFGLYVQLSRLEWLFICLSIGGMFTTELLNTAIERTVDLYGKDFHPLAKQAKDIAASACLIFALTTVIIGLVIFVPKITSL